MSNISRRHFVKGVAGASVAALAPAATAQQVISILPPADTPVEDLFFQTPVEDPFYQPPPVAVERNISAFTTYDWRPHFSELGQGAILVDTRSRSLHYWPEDGRGYWIFPTSVPMSPELTRLGRTKVTQKVEGPDWRPTPNMLKRDPSLPEYVGPGPQNPLGTHALYLSWQYYRIHGTNDTRKIGRMSSNGCIGLFNEDIEQLFAMAKVGAQVLLI